MGTHRSGSSRPHGPSQPADPATTRLIRQPAFERSGGNVRQPAYSDGIEVRPAAAGHAPETRARERAQERARQRMRRADLTSLRDSVAGSAARTARGNTMELLRLSLTDLHERHARLARIANKSEKTIAWYRGAL